jgi:cell division inhibitor SulA/protein ImuA
MSALIDPAAFPGVWRGGEFDRAGPPGIPTGYPLLDQELPGGGWPRSALTEILHDGVGLGEVSLLFGALRTVAGEGKAIAWINPPYLPYAPALAKAGVALDACLVVRPATPEDALWSSEQALRSGACGAIFFWLPERTDYAWLRRLQMAAESSRALAVLFRPTSAASLPTPAHLRATVSQDEGRLLVRLPKRRGPPMLQPVAVRITGRPVIRHREEGAASRPVCLTPFVPAAAIARHALRASV